jgi:hypothetical protein
MSSLPTGYTHNNAANFNHSVHDSARSNASDMQKYFGPLRNADVDTFASDAFAHETHNLPRAFVGRNKFLMATIDFLITKDDDWYTRSVLPWLHTEELHVKWNIWRFNKTMMDYEPEQGVPRYVSYESESRSDSLVRRGLAFIIEHGFYKTELGRQHYLMNLKQIVEAVHETVYFGVMHELMAAPNYYEQWQAKHGRAPSIITNDAVNALAEERWRFACVQKDIKGLFILDAEIKDRMRRVGIEPTSWIFPSKMAIYASMVPEYFNEFIRAGDKATTALESGAKRFDTFRGCNVHETRPFDTDFMSSGSIEPLMRDREIGEYYVCPATYHDEKDFARVFKAVQEANALHPGHPVLDLPAEISSAAHEYGIIRVSNPLVPAEYLVTVDPGQNAASIKIFDMSKDKFEELKYSDALVNSVESAHPHSGTNIDVITELLKKLPKLTMSDLRSFGLSRETYELHQGEHDNRFVWPDTGNQLYYDDIQNYAFDTGAYMQELIDLVKQAKEHDKVLILPHKMLIFRPRQSYRMGTAILLKGGEELGQTLHGHHDFQLTDDVIHKTHIGHYTFYSKSVVREPKNMYIAEDVYCAGYNGGENTKYLTPAEIEDSFSAPVDHRTKSLIAIPIALSDKTPACMSLNGSFERQQLIIGDDEEGNYATSDVMGTWVNSFMGKRTTALQSDPEDTVNGICFQGATQTRHSKSQPFTETQHNTGHWGPSVYDGCANVRQGMYAHLRPPGSSTAISY